MSRNTHVRTAKGITAATLFVVLVASMGSATAAPASSSRQSVDLSSVRLLARTEVTTFVSPGAVRASRAIAKRAAVVARKATYTRFTLRSTATKDLRGVERSLYRGKYYRPAVEAKRLCIADRESEGHYDVVSPSGLYFGAYQVSRPLARGATWMMLKEHKRLMGAKRATKALAHLRGIPMNRWPRYWQDAAFSTIMNWESTASGAAHWAGGRWRC